MKSFIPWIGGKSQLRKIIIDEFPKPNYKRFVEVFGGAGWVLFAKDSHAPIEVLNDLDSNLINLYRCIKYHRGELQREISFNEDGFVLNSRELFKDYLAQINTRGLTDIQRAAKYFYIVKISFGADKKAYGCNKKNIGNAIKHLTKIEDRIKDLIIENNDFATVIKTYNKIDTLFYLDPPYYNTENYYNGFAKDDHVRLYKALQSVKGNWVLSYNDTSEIRQLYSDFNIIPVSRANSLTAKNGQKTKKYHELIIKNY